MRHFFDLFMKGSEGALVSFFSWGWHGVDLFFALSGFLIGGQIIEECRNREFSFSRFFVKRSFRILPPYFFAIAVFVAFFSYANGFLILRDSQVLNDFLAHAFYLQDYIQSGQMMYNGIYWSLAVEEKFYIVLPVIIFFLYSRIKNENSCCLLFALGALALVGIAVRFISFEPGKEFWSTYLVPFHLRFDNLLMGVLAAFLFIYFRGRLSTVWKYALLLAAAICLGLSYLYGGLGTSYFNVCWQFTLTGVGFSALILALVSFNAGRYLPFKKAFSAVSKYSYAMYLYHLLILGFTHSYLRALLTRLDRGTAGFLLVFALYFAVVTAVSMAVYAVIDRPFMNYREKLLRKNEKETEAAAADAVS